MLLFLILLLRLAVILPLPMAVVLSLPLAVVLPLPLAVVPPLPLAVVPPLPLAVVLSLPLAVVPPLPLAVVLSLPLAVVPAPSFCSGAAPVPAPVVDTSLWTAIKQTSLAQYLSSRFDTNFGEHANVNGKLSAIQGGDSEAQVRFYVSSSLVVKAYKNVLKSNAEKHYLARGLHEIAATAFVCDKKGWKCEVFGVRIDGITHICLLRARLKSKPLTADEASTAFVDVLETTEVAHGDTHPENVLEDASGGFEVLDCERSFLIDKKLKAEIASTIRIYAHEPLKRPDLLNVIRKQGLEATRHRFILLARKFLNSHRDIFDLGIDELFATFENKN
jgi:hypothetical protein